MKKSKFELEYEIKEMKELGFESYKLIMNMLFFIIALLFIIITCVLFDVKLK